MDEEYAVPPSRISFITNSEDLEYDVPPTHHRTIASIFPGDTPPSLPPKKSHRSSSFYDVEGLSKKSEDSRPKPLPRKNVGTKSTSPGLTHSSTTSNLDVQSSATSSTDVLKGIPTPRPRTRLTKTKSMSFDATAEFCDESLTPTADFLKEVLSRETEEKDKKLEQDFHQFGLQDMSLDSKLVVPPTIRFETLDTDFSAGKLLVDKDILDLNKSQYEGKNHHTETDSLTKTDFSSEPGKMDNAGKNNGFQNADSIEEYATVVHKATHNATTGFETSIDPFKVRHYPKSAVASSVGVLQPIQVWDNSVVINKNSGGSRSLEEKTIAAKEPESDEAYDAVWLAKARAADKVRPNSNLMAFSPKRLDKPKTEPFGSNFNSSNDADIDQEMTYNIPPPSFCPPPLPAQASVPTSPPSIPPRPTPPSKFTHQQLVLDSLSHTTESCTDQTVDVPSPVIFAGVGTPRFNPFPDDPFKYSGFLTECQNFNMPLAGSLPSKEASDIYEVDNSGRFKASWPDTEVYAKCEEDGNLYQQIESEGLVETEFEPQIHLSHVPPPPPRSRQEKSPEFAEKNLTRRSQLYSLAKYDEETSNSVNSVDSSDCSDDNEFSIYKSGTPGDTTCVPVSIIPGATSPRKSDRYGYLYKQGGPKANKGWKQRWVVFNGKDLRYYESNKSQISKKIIPLSSMKEVISDVKETDEKRFKFRLVTTLRDRVFVFAADTRDDCCTWTSTLMAAILKNNNTTQCSMEVGKPDKEGFVRFENNNKKYYVAVWKDILCYYDTFEDFQLNCPVHEIGMKLASVKDRGKNKLQLSTHYAYFKLAFDSPQETQSWRMAIEDAIAEGLADDSVLEKVYENDSNRICADCEDTAPHWASINLGIVLCKKCAGIHRMFDMSISKIRSLRMDTRVWTPSLIELMKAIGNGNANLFWEHDLMPDKKPTKESLPEERKKFIQAKYQQQCFSHKHPLANNKKELNEAILRFASSNNLLEAMRIIFSGADLSYSGGPENQTAYQIAKHAGQRLLMELLYQNGGDRQDLEGLYSDEGRLREDIRLQGYLMKTGPARRTFDKRWCVLEHGNFTYYLNETSTTAKDSIDRKNIQCLYESTSDRQENVFEISTNKGNNRIYVFAAESNNDRGMWLRTVAKLISPIAIMDHVGMMDFSLAGLVYMRESVSEDWRLTWIMLGWRLLYFMNKNLKLDHLDLRKASHIKMQDPSSGSCQLCQEKGSCFVLGSPGQTLYIQASLLRDTAVIFSAVSAATKHSGTSLLDQQLTPENVPVIVEKCLTHIYNQGNQEEGIFRKGATQSRVALLLQELRADARAVRLDEYDIHEVANGLKKFLRDLEDSLFTEDRYKEWIRTSQGEYSVKLKYYRYLLEKLPQVNYSTLKCIVTHIAKMAQMESYTRMNVHTLATCFTPSLIWLDKNTMQMNPQDIAVLQDIIFNREFLFKIEDHEREVEAKMEQFARLLKDARQNDPQKSPSEILLPVYMYNHLSQCEMVSVNPSSTAKDVVDYLMRKCNLTGRHFALTESLLKGSLVRPLFPKDNILLTTGRWGDWDESIREGDNICLCFTDTVTLQKLEQHHDKARAPFGEAKFADSKSKSKFKRVTVEFKQCSLALYKDSKAKSQICSWKIEDLTVYLGIEQKRLPPTKFGFTFLVNNKEEKSKSGSFGYCISLNTEADMYKWVAAMLVAQNSDGLLVWDR